MTPRDPMSAMTDPRWSLMVLGLARAGYNDQGGPSGDEAFESTNWNSVLVTANTPRDIVMKLNREINARVLTPETIKMLVSMGYEPGGGAPEVHGEMLRTDTAKWARVAKVAGVKLD